MSIKSTARHLVALAALLPLIAAAQDAAPQSWGLEQLLQQRALVQSGRAKFVEVRRIPSADMTVESSGVLIYRAPDRLERVTTGPLTDRAVVEGDRIQLEIETEPGDFSYSQVKLTQVPGMRPFFVALRALLAGDGATLKRSFRVDWQGDMDAWTLKLAPAAQADQVVREIRMAGRGDKILSMDTYQRNGDSVHTTLTPESEQMKEPASETPKSGS